MRRRSDPAGGGGVSQERAEASVARSVATRSDWKERRPVTALRSLPLGSPGNNRVVKKKESG
jgi:hypothetical protein